MMHNGREAMSAYYNLAHGSELARGASSTHARDQAHAIPRPKLSRRYVGLRSRVQPTLQPVPSAAKADQTCGLIAIDCAMASKVGVWTSAVGAAASER